MTAPNGNGKRGIAELLALAGGLAAILVPMGGALVDLRADLERVEKQAAESRATMREDLREYIQHVEERLAAAIEAHNDWALGRNADLESTTSDLRERTRAVEAALVENETQHKWIADIFNVLRQEVDRRTRAFWDGSKIVYPDEQDTVLESIGEARKNGNNHK